MQIVKPDGQGSNPDSAMWPRTHFFIFLGLYFLPRRMEVIIAPTSWSYIKIKRVNRYKTLRSTPDTSVLVNYSIGKSSFVSSFALLTLF